MTIPVCKNCHALLSDMQKDHPPSLGETPNIPERYGHMLLGLCDMLKLVIPKLEQMGHWLIAESSRKLSNSGSSET